MPPVESAVTIPQMIHLAAQSYGDSIAIAQAKQSISYRQLDQLRQQAARALIGSGVQAGDRVAIWAPNSAQWIIATTALHSVGAVLVPLNTRMKGSEAGYILRESGASLLFLVDQFLGIDFPNLLADEALPDLRQTVCLSGEHPSCLNWTSFLQQAEHITSADLSLREAAVSADCLSDLLFTSGTTGKPKGVMSCHHQNLRAVRDWSAIVGLRAGDRYLIVNPFFHSFGYKAGWLAALMRGCTIVPHQVFDVAAVLECVSRERINVLPGPPTLYQSLLAHPQRQHYDLSSLRIAVTGAAAIPTQMIERMRDELGFATIITAYGLTESCGFASICRAGDPAELIASTSGRAMPDVDIRCIDSHGQPVAAGQPGEVLIRGYNLMRGYFNNPQAGAEAIDSEGWLHTGDIGVIDAQGYLRITDRLKDMFITGGFNVYPAEIEQCLLRYPGLAQAAVIGIPDERLGEVAMAFLLPAPGQQIDTGAFTAWCREQMANYKVPRQVQILQSMPLNASGKITKQALRDLAASTQPTEG